MTNTTITKLVMSSPKENNVTRLSWEDYLWISRWCGDMRYKGVVRDAQGEHHIE